MPTSGMKSLNIKFNLVDDEQKNFKSEIELKELYHDIYFYDFNYSPEKHSKTENIKVGEILSHLEQFIIYLDYLNEIDIEKNSPEFDDLALSTKKLFTIKIKEKDKENKYHDLPLYLTVFASYYENPIISKILLEFDMDKVKSKNDGQLGRHKARDMKNIFNKLENDPEIILMHTIDSKKKLENKENLFLVILCFRYFYDRYNFEKSLKNILTNEDNEDIQNKIYKNLAKYPEVFNGIEFEKNQISKMVENSDSFRRIWNV